MQDPKYVKKAFSRIADRYVVTNHVLSLGTDILWFFAESGNVRRRWAQDFYAPTSAGAIGGDSLVSDSSLVNASPLFKESP